MERILVWGLSNRRAGTETIISNYVSLLPDQQFDFLTYEQPNNFSELFSGTGNRAFVVPHKAKAPFSYRRALRAHFSLHAEEYKALWFNTNHAANIDVLELAAAYDIPRRIVHSHNSEDPQELSLRLLSHAHIGKLRDLATARWACSKVAGDYLFGSLPFRIVPNVVDEAESRFDSTARERYRRELGIENALVIGTIGRLNAQKNQRFLIELLPRLVAANSSVQLVIVGEGELQQDLERTATIMGVSDHLKLLGNRPDARKLLSAFDVFAMPSLYEGLPLALLEAQFNGVPCIIADTIERTAVISSATERLPLDQDAWVKALGRAQRPSKDYLLPEAKLFSLSTCRPYAQQLFA